MAENALCYNNISGDSYGIPWPRNALLIRMDFMAARTIIIVDCLDGALADYCYRRIAGYFEPEFRAVRIAADRDAIPADAAAYTREKGASGMVIGGSQYSPLDPLPWLPALEEFVAGFIQTGLPALGICFGLEIMAAAHGGSLAKRPELAVALREVKLLESFVQISFI